VGHTVCFLNNGGEIESCFSGHVERGKLVETTCGGIGKRAG